MIARLPLPIGMAGRSMPLDALRCLAVTLVVGFHVAVESDPAGFDALAAWVRRYGMLGVDIFFPLSGFLITGFLLRRHAPGDIRIFFLRRLFRIVPLYLVAVGTYALASALTGREAHLLPDLWIPLTFLTGWMIFERGAEAVPYTITWSLSVEEFAYILFGLVALAVGRRLVVVLGAVALGAMALRFSLLSGGASEVYFYPPARLDSIALGGLLAAMRPAESGRWRLALGAMGAGLALSLALFWFADRALSATAFYSCVSFATCIAIALMAGPLATGARRLGEGQGILGSPLRLAALIGFYSYFIYLFHYFFVFAVGMAFSAADLAPGVWTWTAATMAATTLAAAVSHRFFEAPLMRLGRALEGASGRKTGTAQVRPGR